MTSLDVAPCRLSESSLWADQRAFFEREGVAAWSRGIVPHYVTSNPYMAKTYANLAMAFFRDNAGRLAADGRPVHVIEVGAGSGRFGWHFLRQFLPLWDASDLRHVPFGYVMTDLSPRTIEHWLTHRHLRPFVEAGRLDFAHFDAASPADLELIESGATIGPTSPLGVAVTVANYVYDSLPQDCFRVEGGELLEARIALGRTPDRTSPRRMGADWAFVPCARPYYGDAGYETILSAYTASLPDVTFLFPAAALNCLRWFEAVSQGSLLHLVGDKGPTTLAALARPSDPEILAHGSVSAAVNFHALGEDCRRRGLVTLHPQARSKHLTIAGYLRAREVDHAGTRAAYAAFVDGGGPDDFYSVKRALVPKAASLTLDQQLAYLRLSGWDAKVFLDLYPSLVERVSGATPAQREEVGAAVRSVWDMYFPIGERDDLALSLGLVLLRAEAWGEAAEMFHRSLALTGPEPRAAAGIALCHYARDDVASATRWLDEVLRMQPSNGLARNLKQAFGSQRRRRHRSRSKGA